MNMTLYTLVSCVLLSVALLCCPARASAPWEYVVEADGILVERRPLPGSARYEIRASTYAPFPPPVIFATLWQHREYREFVPYLKQLEILEESPHEKVIYEQIKLPLVAPRDYTVTVTATHDHPSGRIQISFVSTPEEGPPEHPKYVRVTDITGGWTLLPTRDGGAMVTYVVASNPGGGIPSWMVNAAQQEAVPNFLKAMLTRVKHKHATP